MVINPRTSPLLNCSWLCPLFEVREILRLILFQTMHKFVGYDTQCTYVVSFHGDKVDRCEATASESFSQVLQLF